jgi:hypothetical protein
VLTRVSGLAAVRFFASVLRSTTAYLVLMSRFLEPAFSLAKTGRLR